MNFPKTRQLLGEETWRRLQQAGADDPDPELVLRILTEKTAEWGLPAYLPDLARLERTVDQVDKSALEMPRMLETLSLNPSLQLFQTAWKNLPLWLAPEMPPGSPPSGREWILIWRKPDSGQTAIRSAAQEDLLALKILAEEIDPEEAARAAGYPPALVQEAIRQAVEKGLLLAPSSKIRRDFNPDPGRSFNELPFLSSPSFTLQWHLTQACDLHCRHCYDRSSRPSLSLSQSLDVLKELQAFCRSKQVTGHISFTGGNPFLYPDFFQVYQAASEAGFSLAILGNPVSRGQLERILAIRTPDFFQVSLEGLPEHNDTIRGEGHFERTLGFLSLLKEVGIYSMVMLTLTRENLPQVLPLAEILREKTEAFFFNRLSQVGEGARLRLPDPKDFQAFLKSYLEAMKENPLLGLKDNLFNILLDQEGREPFGGCAGYGCSAAFNFLTLLPDGEVQACRKFPSPIGHILKNSLLALYDSQAAQRYRAGSAACAPCPIRPVCGGCLAVAHGLGLNIFEDRDPFCFYS